MNEALTGGIVWNSNTYTPQPVSGDGFAYVSSGSLPRPTLTLSNINLTLTTLMTSVNATTSGNDLVGATVKRIRVLKKHLDGESAADPYASFPTEIFLIDRKATETLQTVTYELASEFDMIGQAIPRRQLLSNVCQWEYRSTECGYSGSNYWDVDDNAVGTLAADRCGKRISSCKLRFGGTNGNDPLPFGSFPGIGLQ
jgi:lambda family phage minor tail protein L